MKHPIHGVHSAAATPVTTEGEPDLRLFAAHCRALLDEGCHGIAMLGTTGEANSFGLKQRMALLEGAVEGGVPAATLVPGTSAPSVADTIALTSHAVRAGAKGVVMLPPYYYKGVSDEGLFRFYARVIEGVGDDRLRIVLYHIPQFTMAPLSHDLIARLLEAFPGVVCGIKDSSGDLENMRAMCEKFPALGVLAGADPLMLPVLQAGGAGCITATSNVQPGALRVVWDNWRDPAKADEVEAAQARIVEWRNLSSSYVQIPTVKAMVAHRRGDITWANMMPPLVALSEPERQAIWAEMDRLEA
jgi:4-hydroxy-tetrahydrodipicolinate synthase